MIYTADTTTKEYAKYKVNIGRRDLYFATLHAATEFCNQVAARQNIILSIVEVQ